MWRVLEGERGRLVEKGGRDGAEDVPRRQNEKRLGLHHQAVTFMMDGALA